MHTYQPQVAAKPPTFPLLRIAAAFPIACFTGALLTDLAYAGSANMIWADFSDWLLAVGMATGVLAALIGLVDLAKYRRTRPFALVWPVALGSAGTLIVAFINNLVHSRDAWTSVVPGGLILSAVTVAVTLATAWLAGASTQHTETIVQYQGVVR